MGELEATKVTPDTVQRAIMKLKREKSDGKDLISDHWILAPTSFTKILASVVTSLLQHGHKHAPLSTWTHACPVINMDTCMPCYQYGHVHALLSIWTHACPVINMDTCPVINMDTCMPCYLSDVTIQPIPTGGSKDYSLSTNY